MSRDYFIKNDSKIISGFGLPAFVQAVEEAAKRGCDIKSNTAYRAGGSYSVRFEGEYVTGDEVEVDKTTGQEEYEKAKEEAQRKMQEAMEADEERKAAEAKKQQGWVDNLISEEETSDKGLPEPTEETKMETNGETNEDKEDSSEQEAQQGAMDAVEQPKPAGKKRGRKPKAKPE